MTPIHSYDNPEFKCSNSKRIWGVVTIFIIGTLLTTGVMLIGHSKLSSVSDDVSDVQVEVQEMRQVLKEYSETTTELATVVSNISKQNKENGIDEVKIRLDAVEEKVAQLENIKNKMSK